MLQKRLLSKTLQCIIFIRRRKGHEILKNPFLNKGTAFTIEERMRLGIHGYLPARVKTQEEQVARCLLTLRAYESSLQKYIYLMEIHDRCQKLFYQLLTENIEELMPVIYTPTVGLACQLFGMIYRRHTGFYITYNDKGHIRKVLKNWREKRVDAVCVTDGERILGLGDLGVNGIGVSVGKLILYTALGGIHPRYTLPIQIDVGTNNEQLLNDPYYLGLRMKRCRGAEYDELIDEFMDAVAHRFGHATLVQFEDFANENAFRLKQRYMKKYCTFNDDIQGTAAAALAGIYASERLTGKDSTQYKYLFAGAGQAAIGISQLIVRSMMVHNVSEEEAYSRITMVDLYGLLTTRRKTGEVQEFQRKFAKDMEPITGLNQIIATIKPDVLIGVSGAGNIFTPEVIRTMATHCARPVIFAMSNPTEKAECTPEQAYEYSDGRAILATGSPVHTVDIAGKTYYTSQGNNAYIFPGVALGLICARANYVPEEFFLVAAKILASFVGEKELQQGQIYPPLYKIRDVSFAVAIAIVDMAYKSGIASVYPQPENICEFVQKQLYDSRYRNSIMEPWEWKNPPRA